MREEDSVLRDFAVLAIATVTQVIFLKLTPTIEPITSHPLKVYTCAIYIVRMCYVLFFYIYYMCICTVTM